MSPPQSLPSTQIVHHAVRGILRHLKLPSGGSSSATSGGQSSYVARTFIRSKFRSLQSVEVSKAEELRTLAVDYYALQRDIRERSKLHQLDAGAEEQLSPRELSRRAAARAGLQLPKLPEEL